MKNYIRDNGKVRNCPANLAKMNVFEYIYYYKFKNIISNIFWSFKNYPFDIRLYIGLILLIAFFPLNLFIISYFEIRENKKFVKQHSKDGN